MTRQIGPLERAAHGLADVGWPVFPCAPGRKVPVTEHGFQEATTDHAQIEQWWAGSKSDRNVAIATGTPGPDVLDVDKHGPRKGDSGYPALSRLIRAELVVNPNATVRTPSGGAHLYFAGTEQGNGHMARQHLDFRSKGGYVVAPPSQVGGRKYEVLGQARMSGRTVEWDKVRDFLEPPAGRIVIPVRPCREDASVDRIIGFVGRQDHGNRNGSLYWGTHELIRLGQLTPENQARLIEASVASGLAGGQREAERTVASALRSLSLGQQRQAQ
jgi:hypothetical protein